MAHGIHIATCCHCGKQWVVGDCIPDTCDECYQAGHRGWALNCARCNEEQEHRLAAARAESERRKQGEERKRSEHEERHRQRPWPRKAAGFRRGW